MGVLHSTQRRVTFIFTIEIQNLVCTISCPFRRQLMNPNEGLYTLRLGASLGAIHDSAERLPTFVFNARVYTYLTPLCVKHNHPACLRSGSA